MTDPITANLHALAHRLHITLAAIGSRLTCPVCGQLRASTAGHACFRLKEKR